MFGSHDDITTNSISILCTNMILNVKFKEKFDRMPEKKKIYWKFTFNFNEIVSNYYCYWKNLS